MRALGLLVLLGPAVVLAAAPASPPATPGECSGEAAGTSRCVYRSLLPSAGIVASCRDGHECRVGYYHNQTHLNGAWT